MPMESGTTNPKRSISASDSRSHDGDIFSPMNSATRGSTGNIAIWMMEKLVLNEAWPLTGHGLLNSLPLGLCLNEPDNFHPLCLSHRLDRKPRTLPKQFHALEPRFPS